ncbi:T9SS type A sorting domain-containing protein [Flavobacterium silvaticum]|uniref:T9SS type A sorting domain-containing protein n=1 Tax=Flavobacterium silvaticum TaxID=1852020 RepID=A0A972FUP6_9FLAO|nr:T9SS type A sorting domain-containing protein [Flavobacterium silvaticum]NMH28883.1 T9SS type A sorting domain-containing protein [Flavobacterium silvaticum]
MKKITLLSLLLVSGYGFAQDTCAEAVPVSLGLTVVGDIDGNPADETSECWGTPGTAAEWYSYTPTELQVLKISTAGDVNPFDNDAYDTRLSIYTGTCDALTCFNGNDDVSDSDYRSELIFVAEAGVTYYFAWDDRWLASGFTFSLEVLNPDCSTALPFTEDFEAPEDFYGCYQTYDLDGNGAAMIQQNLDLDGDGEDETFLTAGVATTDDANDWTFSPAIAMVANGTYNVSIAYNGADSDAVGDANEAFELVWADAPSPDAPNQTVVGTYTDIIQNGLFEELQFNATVSDSTPFTPPAAGNYYLGIHVNSIVGGGFLLIFNYTVTETLGTQDVTRNVFSTYPNPAKSMLTLVQNETINSYEVFDMLGNKVMSEKVNASSVNVNVTSLATGTYVVKAQSASGTQVSKFVKS